MTLLRDYAAAATQPTLAEDVLRYDEVAGPDGALRPGWKALAAELGELTSEELRRVDAEIGRFLADDGVTYTRPGQPSEPWRLDPVPLVLGAEEWAPLEVALTQRTELLNAILVDLYGARRLLAEGVLPPEVVFGHTGYLRTFARDSVQDPRPLVVAAADLGRTASGEWRVLADRAQAPSGLGYAMENRRVISRVLPRLYREAGLHRMAPFFQALRSALMLAGPDHVDNPRVVVLTPGTHSETAYDQAFLASRLGFPLVQGSDLTVREGAVWMRVFGRLERVDVILRRVDASWSDPLELRGESHLGVAGLSEAIRRGTVRVVNGLGAGVLENPALMPYLSQACELLLDEPLRLPSVRTHWLGDPRQREWANAHLGEVLIRATDRPGWRPPSDPAKLRRLIDAAPYRYVAQEPLTLSQAPVLSFGAVAPAPVVLRAFTIGYGSTYRPLVGGLASVVDGTKVVSSKDVWVLKAERDEPDQGLTEVLALSNVRAPEAMVPRALEDLFWLGRYAERAEDTLRLVLASHAIAEDYRTRPHSSGGATLAVLLGALGRLSTRQFSDDLDAEFRSLLLDRTRLGSVAQSLSGMREAAEGVRDRLSGDLWRAFGSVERANEALTENPHSHQVAESGGRMLNATLALYGVTANMVRDPGWRMIGVGRALERSLQLLYLLRATITQRRGIDVDREVHQAVLVASESSVTHQMRFRGYLRPATVLELLLLDRDNPRSLAGALDELREHLGALPTSTGSTRPERLTDDLADEIQRIDLSALVAIEGEGRPHLERQLDNLLGQVSRLADAIADLHLASGPAQRSFGLGRRLAG